MFEKIPAELKMLPRWVCAWDGGKCPMQSVEKKAASSINPATWSSYQAAQTAVGDGVYDNLGFVFNGDGYVGIDIDAGFDEDGFLTPLAIDIIGKCESYTEISRSGRGVHIILKGDLPFKGRNNQNGVEIYSVGRYFIMTGKQIVYPDIIHNQKAIDYVCGKYFPEVCQEGEGKGYRPPRRYTPVYAAPNGGRIAIAPSYPPVPQGGRNDAMLSLGGQLREQGYDKSHIYAELLKANSKACQPPLAKSEIEHIVNSVMKYKKKG